MRACRMNLRPAGQFLGIGIALVVGSIAGPVMAAKPGVQQTARQVDKLIAEQVFTKETKLAPAVNDATYLRRVWLDIVGDIPAPEHVTAFLLDTDSNKREKVVNELLSDPQYGQ